MWYLLINIEKNEEVTTSKDTELPKKQKTEIMSSETISNSDSDFIDLEEDIIHLHGMERVKFYEARLNRLLEAVKEIRKKLILARIELPTQKSVLKRSNSQ